MQDFCLQQGYKHANGHNDYRLATKPGDSTRIDAFMAIWLAHRKVNRISTPVEDFTTLCRFLTMLGRAQGWFAPGQLRALDSVDTTMITMRRMRTDISQE